MTVEPTVYIKIHKGAYRSAKSLSSKTMRVGYLAK